ncbi:MAG: SseB family protein [Myxococcota bacterium]
MGLMWARVKDWWLGPERVRSLRGHLEALTEERFSSHRCVVQAGLSRLHVELAEAGYRFELPRDFEVDPFLGQAEQVPDQLIADGYASTQRGVEWLWRRDNQSLNAAVNEVERLLHTRMGFQRDLHYSVSLECTTARDNEPLRASMKTLAQERSPNARKTLYQDLLSAFVLLAVDEDGARIRPYEDPDPLAGRPVWHVFTHAEALEEHKGARGAVVLSGIRLFQSALAQRVGALRLNFASSVGGELYGHELKRVADAFPAALPPPT